jgi:hypothetical protein
VKQFPMPAPSYLVKCSNTCAPGWHLNNRQKVGRGLSVFDLLRYRRHDHVAVLCAFDLIELDGEDLRAMRAIG